LTIRVTRVILIIQGGTNQMATSGKDMVKELEKDGWRIGRIHGSHYIMEKDGKTIVVPVHGNKTLKPGIERRIRKDAGLA